LCATILISSAIEPMTNIILIIVIALAAASWIAWRGMKARRRAGLLASPLSPERRAIAEASLPLFGKLPGDLRTRLEGLINLFLHDVIFIGQDGLEITDEMRVTIAGQAALLIVNKENRWFKTLETILVYPSDFKSKISRRDGALHTEHDQVRSGESWDRGPVVLSWDSTAYGAFIPHDGQNVVLHEFAHQLDQQTGTTDGAPLLDKTHKASEWAKVLSAAYERMTEDLARGRETFLDPYGATAPAEFFAVATEYFFEKPEALKDHEPELYAQLAKYYRLDPAGWG